VLICGAFSGRLHRFLPEKSANVKAWKGTARSRLVSKK
jgi:hypothetical protein